MKESQTILETYKLLEAENKQAVLATVVDVKGSSYRLPGARMLIDETGRSVGTVSGGCLEADVLERAKKVLKTGEPAIITYDTTRSDDSIFGLGMGCRGVIRVLLEPARNNKLFGFLRDCFAQRIGGVIVALISKPENFPLSLSTNFFIRSNENSEKIFDETDVQVREVLQTIFADAKKALNEKVSSAKSFETAFGKVEFFIETIQPPVSLLLFGAGYDALPLADFAKNLGWRVSIVDHRPAWATAERFPAVDEIIVARAEDLDAQVFQDENSVAVLMTHNYERDREILRRLLNSSVKYIGALGPKKRTENMLAEIGEKFDERQLAKIYSPVGLDIGAETPEEIALAIVAEIKSVLTNRTGKFLRERTGGIH